MKAFILGAGFTGMAAGIKTGLPIYEATDKAGGICTSYKKDGFEFFNGGPHLLFGKGIGLDYVKSLVPVNEIERKAGVYYNHIFPYPIQTVAQQENMANAGTLKHWLMDNFSRAENNFFFYPFNEKYSAGLYNEVMQSDDYKTPKPGTTGFSTTFCDPVNGLGDLVDKMAAKCDIHYNKIVTKIDVVEKLVIFSDGSIEEYDKLISTISLNTLLALCGEVADLPFSSVYVLNIGAEEDVMTPQEHWLYVPFCKTNFHRIGFYSNIDKTKAPEGKVNLSVEMAFCGFERDDLDEPFIIKHVVEELQAWRFIGDTITIDPTWVRCGYTWLKSKEDANDKLKWLKGNDIISTGRYGKWKFQGMVDSIKDGFEVRA